MFVVTVIFDIELSATNDFITRVKKQAQDSLHLETGCHRFDICIDSKRSGRIMLYEIYDDTDAFAAHLDSDHFRAFDNDVSPHVRSKKIESWSLA